VTLWLAAIAAAVLLQLAPLPLAALAVVSPHASRLISQLDVLFATGAPIRHAISIAPASTITALALFVAFAVMMLGLARALSLTGARALAACIAALGALIALVAIVQQPLYEGKIYGVWTPLMGGTPYGPFVNKNHFAGWMLMAVPLTLGLLCAVVTRATRHVQPDWRHRLIWLSSPDASRTLLLAAAAALMALSLVLTMSRSGILACAVSLAITSGWVIQRLPSGSTRIVAAAYVAGLTLLVIGWAGADTIAARFAIADTNTVNDRLPIWRDTLLIVRDFWLTGTGLNTYGVATLFYQTSLPQYHLREAHNDYLQLAAEGGLLLAIPIAGAVAAFALAVRRRFRVSSGSSYWIRMGAVMGIVAIAAQSIVDFSLQMPGNALLFAVLCGIALHRDRRVSPASGGR
jgi:O-antigen ligase